MGLLTPLAVKIGSIEWLPRYLPYIVKVDEGLQKVTGGRVDLLDVAGLPSVTILVVGRKSGVERSTTVLAAPAGADWIVAGSYFGGPKTPAWVLNLRAADGFDIEQHGRRIPMRAHELAGDERERAWDELRRVWPNFDMYARRTDRTIPLFRLSPA